MARGCRPCKHCRINYTSKSHRLCRGCYADWHDAQVIAAHGIPVPDDFEHKLKIEAAAAGWRLLMADHTLRWRALGTFADQPACEIAGRAVLAAMRLVHT
jgi:hypothetical protein